MEVGMMFSAIGLAPAVAKYLGIIEDKLATVEAKVDRLGKSEFEAGVRALLQAGESKGEEISLLREARNRFNQAIGLEAGVRLAHAHLGLALCHKHLGDTPNMISALKSLIAVPSPAASPLALASKTIQDNTPKAVAAAAELPWWAFAIPVPILLPVAGVVMAAKAGRPGYDRWMAEKQHIDELKTKVAAFLQDDSSDLPQCSLP